MKIDEAIHIGLSFLYRDGFNLPIAGNGVSIGNTLKACSVMAHYITALKQNGEIDDNITKEWDQDDNWFHDFDMGAR